VTTREGFPKSCRLTETGVYKAAFEAGHLSRDRFFAIYLVHNSDSNSRLGLAVSRRVSPKSAIRNAIKRQIREWFRKNRQFLEGWDVVVVAQNGVAGVSPLKMRQSLEQHWQKLVKTCER